MYTDGFSNDPQVACKHSRRTTLLRNEKPRIDALVADGKTVLTVNSVVRCPRTDALLGTQYYVLSVWDTDEEAEAEYRRLGGDESNEEYVLSVRSLATLAQRTRLVPTATTDSEVFF